jgi:hypothetical protein
MKKKSITTQRGRLNVKCVCVYLAGTGHLEEETNCIVRNGIIKKVTPKQAYVSLRGPGG